jgi:cytochrome b561
MSEALHKSPTAEASDSKLPLYYGTIAKALHWLIVALLAVQYLIGWFMPDTMGGVPPGPAMTWHISIGTTILAIMLFRFGWRLTHPVAPESSLPAYQRIIAAAVYWLLYLLVLFTTLSGWLLASARGWKINWFFGPPLPMLTHQNSALNEVADVSHHVFEWSLLVVMGIHICAGLLHLYYYRDGIIRRMLPGGVAGRDPGRS